MLGKAVVTSLTFGVLLALGSPGHAAPKSASTPGKSLGAAWTAYDAGHYADAYKRAARLKTASLANRDYALYLTGQAAYHSGNLDKALVAFQSLRKEKGSRFASTAVWREADCQWELGNLQAAKSVYEIALSRHSSAGITTLALLRMGHAEAAQGRTGQAIAFWRKALLTTPLSPWEDELKESLRKAGGPTTFGPEDLLARANSLHEVRRWEEAVAELEAIPEDVPAALAVERDYAIAESLFSRRRQYERAGKLYLSVYQKVGDRGARALFKGARALSRADKDDLAVRWYGEVVKRYPKTQYAAEAQFLAGWLEFNAGKYRKGLPALEESLKRFGRSRWADDARWTLGFSHYLLGECERALPYFQTLASGRGELDAGKGAYWAAVCEDKLGRKDDAQARFSGVVTRWPLSWYALLASTRLNAAGVKVAPFSGTTSAIDALGKPDPKVAADPRLDRADELLDAGWSDAASYELQRVERGLRTKWKARAMPVLLDKYRRAGNFNRPWMLATVMGSRALDQEPKGSARTYWEHAYPRAYREHVEKHQGLGKNPPYWLYSIMHKESGFNPNIVSYADAIGLMQMIPPTTMRVAQALGQVYDLDRLFDPEWNIKVASWYIGQLFQKFGTQVPLAAGSFNAGPKAVMRWIDQWGKLPMDEFVERVSYTQTREYMKKVTAIYARYLYLYDGTLYEQPLTVNAAYANDELTY